MCFNADVYIPHPTTPNICIYIISQKVELKKLWKNKRNLAFQGLNLAMIVFSALMIWKGLMFVTLSESPVVVVLRFVRIVHHMQHSLPCLAT